MLTATGNYEIYKMSMMPQVVNCIFYISFHCHKGRVQRGVRVSSMCFSGIVVGIISSHRRFFFNLPGASAAFSPQAICSAY
jgi:hypothetical protein